MPEPTITYTWRIEQLDVAPEENELTDVVHTIHWRLLATDGDHTVDTYGSVPLDLPDSTSFTDYSNLTFNKVVEWLEAKIDSRAGEEDPTVEQLRSILAGSLADAKTPTTVPKEIPWQ